MSRLFLLTLLLCFALSANAQKSKYESVTYTYLRNPIERLDATIENYEVQMEVAWIEKEKQKQLDYEMELEIAEHEYNAALEEYNTKSTGSKLAEKVLLGDGKPTKRYVEPPIFFPQPNISTLTSKIALDGFNQGTDNSILIKISFKDIYISPPNDESKTTEEIAYKKRSISVKQPVEISVITPNGDILLNRMIASNRETHIIAPEVKADEWGQYLTNSWDSFFNSKLMKIYDNLINEVNRLINNIYGYSNVKRTLKLYTGKSKKHSYDTHLLALRKAQRAYENLTTERQESIDALKKAIEIWENELKEAQPSNKKARINGDIYQAILLNIAEAKTTIGDYNGATDYCDKLDVMPDAKNKYIRRSEKLRKFIKDEKLRNP